MFVCEISVANLSFQHPLLCAGFPWWFPAGFFTSALSPAVWHWPEMALQADSGGQLTWFLGSRLLLWSQVIHAWVCMFLKLFQSWLSKEKKIKALVLPALLHSHSQPGSFSLSLTTLSWSEVRRPGIAWSQELKEWGGRLFLGISFLCLPQGGFWSSLCKGNLSLPSLSCGLPLPLILHTGGAVPLALLSLICLSMPQLGAFWLVGNVAQVQGQALVFVSKCRI